MGFSVQSSLHARHVPFCVTVLTTDDCLKTMKASASCRETIDPLWRRHGYKQHDPADGLFFVIFYLLRSHFCNPIQAFISYYIAYCTCSSTDLRRTDVPTSTALRKPKIKLSNSPLRFREDCVKGLAQTRLGVSCNVSACTLTNCFEPTVPNLKE